MISTFVFRDITLSLLAPPFMNPPTISHSKTTASFRYTFRNVETTSSHAFSFLL